MLIGYGFTINVYIQADLVMFISPDDDGLKNG